MTTILIIEDEENIRVTIRDILELYDFNVEVAENGRIGYNKAVESIPDIIICDVMMPEMNGFETLRSLRDNNLTKAIPFIFLTAKADKADFREGMNIGADDFLTKPFHAKELLKVIELRLNKQKERKEPFENEIEILKNDIKKFNSTFETLSYKNSHILRAPILKIIGLIDFFMEELKEQEILNKNETLEMIKDSCNELKNATVEIEKLLSKQLDDE